MKFDTSWRRARESRRQWADRLWRNRGSLQNPGRDLARLPIGFDFHAINVIEGIRAALASATLVLANEWIGSPALFIAALGAQITCFSDVGGPIRQRLPWLLAFTALGAASWGAFGLLRNAGPLFILPTVVVFVFVTSFFRVWGLAAMAVGNVLTVVLALALDRALTPAEALTTSLAFAGGGLWAIVVLLVLWRIQPDRPVRRAVSEAWRFLAILVGDLRVLTASGGGPQADWVGHARAHRRAVRDAIERARLALADLLRARGPLSQRGAQNLIRLETADQLFGVLLGLSDILENTTDPHTLEAGTRLLRILRPTLLVVSQSIVADRLVRPERIDRAVERMLTISQAVPELGSIVPAILTRLRIVVTMTGAEDPHPEDSAAARQKTVPFHEKAFAPVLANLTWESAILRHSARAAVVSGPAVSVSLIWVGAFQHWLTITVILTMQPYFASTWQRALERIGGTVLGGAIGAVLAFFPQTPVMTAVFLFPLSVIGFAARQVSYGAFIACLTPLIVVLIEIIEPGQSGLLTAGLRIGYTVAGGLLAVASCLILWPTWEPARVRDELRTTLLAYADYADAALAALAGAAAGPVDQTRRAAGIAHNNLEASLSRALQEPRGRGPRRLEATLIADATLRRFGGTLMALHYDPDTLRPGEAALLRDWLPRTLRSIARRETQNAIQAVFDRSDAYRRLTRQTALLQGALLKGAPGLKP